MGRGSTISIFPPVRASRVASPRERSPTITDGANRGSQRNCEPTCNILHIKWQNQTTGANAGRAVAVAIAAPRGPQLHTPNPKVVQNVARLCTGLNAFACCVLSRHAERLDTIGFL